MRVVSPKNFSPEKWPVLRWKVISVNYHFQRSEDTLAYSSGSQPWLHINWEALKIIDVRDPSIEQLTQNLWDKGQASALFFTTQEILKSSQICVLSKQKKHYNFSYWKRKKQTLKLFYYSFSINQADTKHTARAKGPLRILNLAETATEILCLTNQSQNNYC